MTALKVVSSLSFFVQTEHNAPWRLKTDLHDAEFSVGCEDTEVRLRFPAPGQNSRGIQKCPRRFLICWCILKRSVTELGTGTLPVRYCSLCEILNACEGPRRWSSSRYS